MIHEAVILRAVITNLLLVNRFHQKRGSNYGGRQKTQIRERKREHQGSFSMTARQHAREHRLKEMGGRQDAGK